jgi:hypothetical protein
MTQAGNALRTAAEKLLQSDAAAAIDAALRRPLFIVSAPRSGSTLLFSALTRLPGFSSIGGESHGVFRAFAELRAENAALDSGALDARHAQAETVRLLRASYALLLRDHTGQPLDLRAQADDHRPLFIEKTPRQALNIPFLLAAFPDARFVWLKRDPREVIASLIEAWNIGLESGRFVTFRDLPGWDRAGWCFLLPRGWRELIGRPLAEIACFQWSAANTAIMDALAPLPASRWHALNYADLLDDPAAALQAVRRFAGVDDAQLQLPSSLPLSATTVSAPAADKWRRHQHDILALEPQYAPVAARIREFCG